MATFCVVGRRGAQYDVVALAPLTASRREEIGARRARVDSSISAINIIILDGV